ncbi:hypothetical protein ANN_00672 [Periplaneta americana]|uniref:Uncharacterized protein n=1 Tax=Periplaneta americana TaxID=6978 RepID=A0ABQ8TRG0_PERAM|nr:hypothetical protein ANN_00672 [Periplaneta americana]
MDDVRLPKPLLDGRILSMARRGRPRKRWFQNISYDLKRLGISGWWKKAKRRDEWRRIAEEAKAHAGL